MSPTGFIEVFCFGVIKKVIFGGMTKNKFFFLANHPKNSEKNF